MGLEITQCEEKCDLTKLNTLEVPSEKRIIGEPAGKANDNLNSKEASDVC